jgi:GTPase SAR1 family protein
MALMVGSAGTGKTWTISRLIKSYQLENPHSDVAITAPTHKAVRVLKREAIRGVIYSTIHSLLRLKEKKNEHTGKVTFEPEYNPDFAIPIERVKVLILDEVSMLHDELYKLLMPYVAKGLKLIFCGDKVQIPPVGLIDSIPLLRNSEHNMLFTELTEVRRQAEGNPILELATHIRDTYKTATDYTIDECTHSDGSGIIRIKSDTQELDILTKYFKSPEFEADSDFMKVIAWRNATVDQYNILIRSLINDNIPDLPALLVGEKLVMNKAYTQRGKIVLTNNEEVVIEELKTSSVEVELFDSPIGPRTVILTCYEATVVWIENETEKSAVITIVHDVSMAKYREILNEMYQTITVETMPSLRKPLWHKYWKLQDKFADVRYNYAVTAHKSQGSSYQNAFVLERDIALNGKYEQNAREKTKRIEERNRILYVAITRPRHTLFVK